MSEINANDVKILVKNVYVPTETQQFVVVDSLRVRTLKQMIAAALPGNPHPRHQKLIFGGKICDDEHTLAKVLAGQNKDATAQSGDAAGGESAAPFVFHLMVSSSVPRSRPTTPVARPQPPAEETIANPTPTPASVDPTPAAATGGATPAMPQPAPAPHVGAGFPSVGFFGAAPATAAVPPPTTPAPAAASGHGNHHHHHFYAQAIMMQQQAMILAQIQYLQQLQAHHAASAQAGAATGAPQAQTMFPQHFAHAYGIPHHAQAFGHHAHAAAAHGLGGFPAPHLPGAAVPGVPVPPAAEVPAVVEPRERGPVVQAFREILPLFDIRLAMKMTFMLFIIGQDTPTDRLIVLALMSFGAYLHITGIIGKVFEILKRSRGVQGTNGDANGEPGANNANADGVHNHAPGRLGSITQYLRISADRGFLHDVRYFITGLLLSLVPAWHPQPLNIDPAAPAHPEPAMADAGAELPLQGI